MEALKIGGATDLSLVAEENWIARKDFNKFTILREGTESPRIGMAHKQAHADLFKASPGMARTLKKCLSQFEKDLLIESDSEKEKLALEVKKVLALAGMAEFKVSLA